VGISFIFDSCVTVKPAGRLRRNLQQPCFYPSNKNNCCLFSGL
jgi:hypothetical protein